MVICRKRAEHGSQIRGLAALPSIKLTTRRSLCQPRRVAFLDASVNRAAHTCPGRPPARGSGNGAFSDGRRAWELWQICHMPQQKLPPLKQRHVAPQKRTPPVSMCRRNSPTATLKQVSARFAGAPSSISKSTLSLAVHLTPIGVSIDWDMNCHPDCAGRNKMRNGKTSLLLVHTLRDGRVASVAISLWHTMCTVDRAAGCVSHSSLRPHNVPSRFSNDFVLVPASRSNLDHGSHSLAGAGRQKVLTPVDRYRPTKLSK